MWHSSSRRYADGVGGGGGGGGCLVSSLTYRSDETKGEEVEVGGGKAIG